MSVQPMLDGAAGRHCAGRQTVMLRATHGVVIGRDRTVHLVVLLCCASLSLAFALCSIGQPITYDEVRNVIPAMGLAVSQLQPDIGPDAVWSRPLYMGLLAWLIRVSQSEAGLRVIGVVCLLLTLGLLYLLACAVSTAVDKDRRAMIPPLAAALFATNPAVIQGSLLVDTDPTILMAATMLLLVYLGRTLAAKEQPSLIIVSLIFGAMLACKITTPWLAAIAMCVFFSLVRYPGLSLGRLLAAFFGGVLVFSLAWWLLSSIWGLPVFAPVDYFRSGWSGYRQHFAEGSFAGLLVSMPLSAARLLFWGSPYFILAACAVLWRVLRTTRERRMAVVGFSAVCAVLLLGGTLWFGGIAFGFPKYQMPAMPLLAVLAAYGIATELPAGLFNAWPANRALLALGGVSLLYFYFFASDPIYLLNYELRDAVANRPQQLSAVVARLTVTVLVYLAFIPVAMAAVWRVVRWSPRETFAVVVLVGMVTTNLALDARQARADYLTRYAYGVTGTHELAEFLRANVRQGDQLLATREWLFYYLHGDFDDVPGSVWNDPNAVMARLRDPRVRFVIFSIGHHEVNHFRKVFHAADVRAILERDFESSRIGSYTVWIRKGRGKR